jgi:hypothetical protein
MDATDAIGAGMLPTRHGARTGVGWQAVIVDRMAGEVFLSRRMADRYSQMYAKA